MSTAQDRWTDHQIQEFWTEQALQHGPKAQASWSDIRVMELEFRELLNHLHSGEKILDVGCANGATTLQLAAEKTLDIMAVDYIPEMIQYARANLDDLQKRYAERWQSRVAFDVGDARRLQFADAAYDVVMSIRVIINLGTWEQQCQGLREYVRVLKPGGRLILSEATVQGWQRLNDLRAEFGLTPIPMPPFNNYLDLDKVQECLSSTCELETVSHFASSYYVATRVIKPILAKAAGSEGLVADPLCEWNRWAAQWPAIGDYGTQKMMIFRKK
ncbi:MAG: class I SAM-dependent methyltransferase [Planctomycetaceae bacterium]